MPLKPWRPTGIKQPLPITARRRSSTFVAHAFTLRVTTACPIPACTGADGLAKSPVGRLACSGCQRTAAHSHCGSGRPHISSGHSLIMSDCEYAVIVV